MLGGVIPFDALWRTGANEPTMIHTSAPITVAGIPIAAGTYSLYAIPGKTEWTVIINRSTSQWGHESQYTAEVQAIRERDTSLAESVIAGDAHAALLADVDFHEWIYEASGNPLVVQSMQAHWQHLRRSMGEVLRHRDLAREVWNEHAAVLNAISQGDAQGAARAINDHVTSAHTRVGTLLKDKSGLAD